MNICIIQFVIFWFIIRVWFRVSTSCDWNDRARSKSEYHELYYTYIHLNIEFSVIHATTHPYVTWLIQTWYFDTRIRVWFRVSSSCDWDDRARQNKILSFSRTFSSQCTNSVPSMRALWNDRARQNKITKTAKMRWQICEN